MQDKWLILPQGESSVRVMPPSEGKLKSQNSMIFIPNRRVCTVWTRGSTAIHHAFLIAGVTRFLSKINYWAQRDGPHQHRMPSYRPDVAHCHHTGQMSSIHAPQHCTEGHLLQQEGHSRCTCPTSGSSSHRRQHTEMKVYFRSYQIRDFKELWQPGWAVRRSRQHLNTPQTQRWFNVGTG